jgi:hypothetical protein
MSELVSKLRPEASVNVRIEVMVSGEYPGDGKPNR